MQCSSTYSVVCVFFIPATLIKLTLKSKVNFANADTSANSVADRTLENENLRFTPTTFVEACWVNLQGTMTLRHLGKLSAQDSTTTGSIILFRQRQLYMKSSSLPFLRLKPYSSLCLLNNSLAHSKA